MGEEDRDSNAPDVEVLMREAQHAAAQASAFIRNAQDKRERLLAAFVEEVEAFVDEDRESGTSAYLCRDLSYSLVVHPSSSDVRFDLVVHVGHCRSRSSGARLSPRDARCMSSDVLERPFDELLRRWVESRNGVRVTVEWPELYAREVLCSD